MFLQLKFSKISHFIIFFDFLWDFFLPLLKIKNMFNNLFTKRAWLDTSMNVYLQQGLCQQSTFLWNPLLYRGYRMKLKQMDPSLYSPNLRMLKHLSRLQWMEKQLPLYPQSTQMWGSLLWGRSKQLKIKLLKYCMNFLSIHNTCIFHLRFNMC